MNSNSTQWIWGFWRRQHLYILMVRLQSSRLSPCLSPCWSSGNHFWRLFQKTVNSFDCKINSSWGSAPAQLRQVWLAHTIRRHFQVCGNFCWQWQACIRKMCCHYSKTDSPWESKGLMLSKFSCCWSYVHFMFMFLAQNLGLNLIFII